MSHSDAPLPAMSTASPTTCLDASGDATAYLCVELSWNGGTLWTAAKTTPLLSSGEVTYWLGASADDWGHTWAAAELNNSNLLVRLTSVATTSTADVQLDFVELHVTYTP